MSQPDAPLRTTSNLAPTEATRVKNFASFFKNYMSVSAVLAASLPIPVTSFQLITTYKNQTKLLSVYTTLFCFLILGFIFYSRHVLARHMFPEISGSPGSVFRRFQSFLVRVLPLFLILGSIGMVFQYHRLLAQSLLITRAAALAGSEGGQLASAYLFQIRKAVDLNEQVYLSQRFLGDYAALVSTPDATMVVKSIANREMLDGKEYIKSVSQEFLEVMERNPDPARVSVYIGVPKPVSSFAESPLLEAPIDSIPAGMTLLAYYLAIFALAEAAFVLMALREYLQDLLGLSEQRLILPTP